jgi:hypothetical protein
MAHGAGVLFFPFCLKAAGVQQDHDEIGCRFGSRYKQTVNREILGWPRAQQIMIRWIESDRNLMSLWRSPGKRFALVPSGNRYPLCANATLRVCIVALATKVPRWHWAEVPVSF